MLIGVGKPEERRPPGKKEVEQTGLRYAEIRVDSDALTEESFLKLEELLFPREARPALICSPRGGARRFWRWSGTQFREP